MFADFTQRSTEAELIDGSDYGADEFIETLGDLRQVNKYLGGHRPLSHHLFPLIEAMGKQQIRLLDVGTGSADIPARIINWGRARGAQIEFVVVDLNEIAVHEAKAQNRDLPEIIPVRADALNLPFADRSFDFVIASLFLHHFETSQAAQLISSFARVARSGFIINDLRRHPIAYYSIKFLAQIFTQNRLVRNDAAVSVLRGFVESDIAEIARLSNTVIKIHRHFPYRFILIGQQNL